MFQLVSHFWDSVIMRHHFYSVLKNIRVCFAECLCFGEFAMIRSVPLGVSHRRLWGCTFAIYLMVDYVSLLWRLWGLHVTIVISMQPLVWHCSNSISIWRASPNRGIVPKWNIYRKTMKRRRTIIKGTIHTSPRSTDFPSATAGCREPIMKPFAGTLGINTVDE